MSGMFDSKQDKAKKKIERTKQEEKERRKSRRFIAIVIAVLLVVSALAITINSSFIRRTLPVVTIDGVSFTTAEFEYFVNDEHLSARAQLQGMEAMLPDPGRPLSAQQSITEGVTWGEHFIGQALESLTEIVALYNAANASGFILPQEEHDLINEEMAMMTIHALNGGFQSSEQLLQHTFGVAMTNDIYRSILEFVALARAYSEHVLESFEYSDAELAAYYEENRDDLDFFNFRIVTIRAEMLDEHDFATTEDYEEALSGALEEARASAYNIIDGVEDEYDFISAAEIHDFLVFHDPDASLRQTQGEWLPADTRDWMTDDARANGDTVVIEGEDVFFALFFISRDDNNYRIAGMRQLLISRAFVDPHEFDLGELDPAYILAVEEAEEDIRERAATVRELFEAAGETEDALIELMIEHSDDFTDEGYYPNIAQAFYQGETFTALRVVPEIQEWLFEENREIGDWELIYTEAFGYHFVFFTGYGDVYADLIADDRLRVNEHEEWVDNLPRDTAPQRHPAFILVNV